MEKIYIFKGFYYLVYRLRYEVRGMGKLFDEEDDYFDEENIYSEEAREMLLEEDELSPEEEAFMRGYDEAA